MRRLWFLPTPLQNIWGNGPLMVTRSKLKIAKLKIVASKLRNYCLIDLFTESTIRNLSHLTKGKNLFPGL